MIAAWYRLAIVGASALQPCHRHKNRTLATTMENDLWLSMWKNHQIDFHQLVVNQSLKQYWHQLQLPANARIFVPMCGKSHDILWLAGQGYDVVGVELSAIAVAAFFAENHLEVTQKRMGRFSVWQHAHITILCGDFFSLQLSDIGLFDAIYDRAALTAMPENIRKAYVKILISLMPLPKPILLLTLEDIEQSENKLLMAQIDREVYSLYSPYFDISVIYGEPCDKNDAEFIIDHVSVNKIYHMKVR
jgi:thiopurine S-methyltransferase